MTERAEQASSMWFNPHAKTNETPPARRGAGLAASNLALPILNVLECLRGLPFFMPLEEALIPSLNALRSSVGLFFYSTRRPPVRTRTI